MVVSGDGLTYPHLPSLHRPQVGLVSILWTAVPGEARADAGGIWPHSGATARGRTGGAGLTGPWGVETTVGV